MDKHLAVNVYDQHNNAIAGTAVMFKVKKGGNEIAVGPVETQGVKDKPVSIQIPDELDEPFISVIASYAGNYKEVIVDTRQTNSIIIRFKIENLSSDKSSLDAANIGDSPNPFQILMEAQKAVPAVKFALGVAGIGAAAALVNLFVGPTKATIVIITLIFIGMVLLFAFSKLVVSESRSTQLAGIVLLWAVLFFFIIFLGFTVTAFAVEWPSPWSRFLGVVPERPAINANFPRIPSKTGWIFLGYIDIKSRNFVEGPKAEVIQNTFKVKQNMFEIGDIIRIKFPSKVIIIDYATMNTKKNLTSPITKGIVTIDDETGVIIPANAELIVRDISYGSWPGNPTAAVWARIVYADEN